MLGGYIPMFILLALAFLLGMGMMGASFVLGPKRHTKYKEAPYECGMTPVGSARERFPIQFYLVAMLFIIFDIETIFLYPWVVVYGGTRGADKLFLFGEMAVFVVILLVGYFYLWGKGAFDWSADDELKTTQDPKVYERRPPIRFGNEDSGPVQLLVRQTEHGKPRQGFPEEEEPRTPAVAGR